MKKFPEVDEAKALMTEALQWSVMKWLTEKKCVRKTADKANNALWSIQKAAKQRWPEELRSAYEQLAARDGNATGTGRLQSKDGARAVDPGVEHLARAVKQLDDEAYAAHIDAEETFDKADKMLSTSKAREGCRKAILSWELYEKAIFRAEAAVPELKERH
jgi:hypothetical protein